MLSRGWMRRFALLSVSVGLIVLPSLRSLAQVRTEPPRSKPANMTREEQLLLSALAKNPITYPFRFTTTVRSGKVVLSGRVATHVVHDAAVQTAIALGIVIDDQVVIDTAAAYPAAAGLSANPYGASATGAPAGSTPGPPLQSAGMRPYSPMAPWATPAVAPPYVYPPPLFGYYDEPFYGFEPPVITYPPWWGAMSARRLDPGQGTVAPQADAAPPPEPVANSYDSALPPNTVEATVDPTGHAILRGTVPTLEDRVQIGQKLAQQKGITRVTNLLEVDPDASTPSRDTPPPPPTPADVPPIRNAPIAPKRPANPALREAPAARPPAAIAVDNADASARLTQAIQRRPALAGLTIHAALRDGAASLTGRVPSALEAMLAYRAVQQTPGVRSIDDKLEFPVPEPGERNPLLEKGRPEDVEPYLQAQIRRHFGDEIHVDRVRLLGDQLEVRGTVPSVDDRARAEATLRSMPILRGFHVKSVFVSE